ncbi:hypothetical protein BG000_001817 [Podila horticola]|nr:hypothetical protein BG000_001817 [Podila horticola]
MKDLEPDAVPSSQEQETQTQTLSIHHNLSQHSDTPLNTLSAPIHAYQSSIETFQFSDDDASLLETYTQAMAKNKRKTSVDHNHSDTTPAPDQKRRHNGAQTRRLESTPAPKPPPPQHQLQPQPQPQGIKGKGKALETQYQRADKIRSRSMTPAGKAQESNFQIADKIRARSTTPSIRSNALVGGMNIRGPRRILLPQSRSGSETVPTSEDEDEAVEVAPGRKSDSEVETSQPTMDERTIRIEVQIERTSLKIGGSRARAST